MRLPEEGTLQRVATFVAALGIGIATYITIADSGGGAPTCLAGGGGCATVASSVYSHVGGVNIAIFGILAYLLLLAAAASRGDVARLGGFLVSLGGFGYSVYLTYLELFKIHAICQWCVGSAICMTILFGLNTARMLGYAGKPAVGGAGPSPPAGRGRAGGGNSSTAGTEDA